MDIYFAFHIMDQIQLEMMKQKVRQHKTHSILRAGQELSVCKNPFCMAGPGIVLFYGMLHGNCPIYTLLTGRKVPQPKKKKEEEQEEMEELLQLMQEKEPIEMVAPAIKKYDCFCFTCAYLMFKTRKQIDLLMFCRWLKQILLQEVCVYICEFS